MAKKFEYKKRTYDEAKKQANESDAGLRDGYLSPELKLFKPNEGNNKIRLMPPGWDGADHFGYRIAVHYSIGQNKDAYICPFHTVHPVTGLTRQPCPICEERNRVLDTDEEYAKKLKPSQRVLVYLLERGGKNTKPVLKAWAMPASLDKAIMLQAIDEETQEVLGVDDPFEGYDLDIIRSGVNLNTKYEIKVARRPSEVEDFEEEIWPLISDKKSLAANLIFFDYDYIAASFSSTDAKSSKSEKHDKPKKKKGINVETLSYDDLFDFTEDELLDLIAQENLDVNPDGANDLEELAEDIAKELGLKRKKAEPKAEPKTERKPLRKAEPEPADDDTPPFDPDEEEGEDEPEPPKPASNNRDRLANLRNRNK